MEKATRYIIGFFIAFGFYLISSVIATVINVTAYISAGYDSYNSFATSGDVSAIFGLSVVSLANHSFFAWISAKRMYKYAQKHNCVEPWYFICTALFFAFSIIIRLMIVSSLKGWLTVLPHAILIALFGKKYCAEFQIQNKNTTTILEGLKPTVSQQLQPSSNNEEETDQDLLCPDCGARVQKNAQFCIECGRDISAFTNQINYCPMCGNRIDRNNTFCSRCGNRIRYN